VRLPKLRFLTVISLPDDLAPHRAVSNLSVSSAPDRGESINSGAVETDHTRKRCYMMRDALDVLVQIGIVLAMMVIMGLILMPIALQVSTYRFPIH